MLARGSLTSSKQSLLVYGLPDANVIESLLLMSPRPQSLRACLLLCQLGRLEWMDGWMDGCIWRQRPRLALFDVLQPRAGLCCCVVAVQPGCAAAAYRKQPAIIEDLATWAFLKCG
jgi:hypothetical protein